ncbi:hypothetical protein [Acidocella sp. KAb 2-4]|uniref:hypothetical protein n=1 Tax=Acidocella sp. KAb 2-4 TaxID=2885158 RepID=UPI001D077587|nr:hypothetical protein [Acidocella sp. KAb 2-4]MCB5944601.1 hypothetical protein [Acidocella sp. KAb 2-4]
MTREEHMDILAFFSRVMSKAEGPVDVEADAIIRAMFKRNPDAAYHVTKLAMALSAAPAEAQTQPSSPAKPERRRRRLWLATLLSRDSGAMPQGTT